MSEDFLSRWSRLKHQSATEPANRSEAQTAESASPPPDAAPSQAIDVASLPAIESIDAESNVAVFLRAGIPDDLTRAALRTAWVSDPAIRDFVGIAENQWDFNSEGAILGFGSLSAEEYARHVAARTLQPEDTTAAPEVGNAAERESSGVIGQHDPTRPPVPSASALPLQSHPIAQPPVGELQATPPTPACVSESAPQAKRAHGSALPK